MTIQGSTVANLIFSDGNTAARQLHMLGVTSAATLTTAIRAFHDNATAKNLTDGLVYAWGNSLIALTEEHKESLRNLRDNYNWDVQVENQPL